MSVVNPFAPTPNASRYSSPVSQRRANPRPGMLGGLSAVRRGLAQISYQYGGGPASRRGVAKAIRSTPFVGGPTHVARPKTHVPDPTPSRASNPSNTKPAHGSNNITAHTYGTPHPPRISGRQGSNPYSAKLSQVLAQAFGSLTNPAAYAGASAEAQYGGAVKDLARQVASAPAEAAGHQSDIHNWYNQVVNQANKGAAADQVAGQAATSSADASNLAIINALGGGPAAASVAAFGQIGRNGISATAQNNEDFQRNMASAIAAEGASTGHSQQVKDTNALAQLRSDLTEARVKKGAAYSQALGEAQSQRFTQLGQLQNMLLGQQLSGPQLQAAQLANRTARQGLDAGWIANQTSLAQLKDFQKNSATGGKVTFDKMKPDERAGLQQNLEAMFVGKHGRLRVSPGRVMDQLRSYMYDTAGIPKSPETAKYLNSVWNDILYGGSGVGGMSRVQEYDKGHRTAYAKKYKRA